MRVLSVLFLCVPVTISCRDGEDIKLMDGTDADESADTADADESADADVATDADGSPDTGDSGGTPTDTSTPSSDTADSAIPSSDTADSGSASDTASDTGDILMIDLDEDGFTALDGDCDDTDPTIFPEADELCDEKDNDCNGEIDEDPIDAIWSYSDMDSDGYGDDRFSDYSCTVPAGYVLLGGDCDDTSATTHPDAAERCDDIDNDCDEEIDEDVLYTWYADTDGDGYGDSESAIESCDPGPGYVATATDCDDTDPTANPGSFEICDGIDNNCDDAIDEDAVDATDWYPDADTDGFGSGEALRSCSAPDDHTAIDGDCNDEDPAVHPGAIEVCDDADTDEDCSGAADDEDGSVISAGMTMWYPDADEDGYGALAYGLSRCDAPDGYVVDGSDCDDGDGAVSPVGVESCNGIDDDCDGDTDEDDATDLSTWFIDADGDGYGNPDTATEACEAPERHVADNTDCDDARERVHPDADELCNEVDDDCDGDIDEDDATDASVWYADDDGDGYGSGGSMVACLQPVGFAEADGDCNDENPAIHPGAVEVCDDADTDEDCSGLADDEDGSVVAASTTIWYQDADDDGFGNVFYGLARCDAPTGYVATPTDCDDTDASVHPDADETCNGIDDDCDGDTDEGAATDSVTWYADGDDDGFGDPETTAESCDGLDGFVADNTDCDDTNGDVNPEAIEWCNDIDDDCDLSIDEDDAEDAATWYADTDGDGFGDMESAVASCSVPDGYVGNSEDCDDESASVYPEATETPDAVDEDCDGIIDEETVAYDDDGDGYSEDDGDCDDGDVRFHPGAEETADGEDEDCDGIIDEETDIYDDDGDGFSEADGDCDDGNPDIFEGATEIPDGVDQDCDGIIDEETVIYDDDGDGFSELEGDCDDATSGISPASAELCNGLDDNCDGRIDEDEAEDAGTWFEDADGDAYGNPAISTSACAMPDGYIADDQDCNDENPAINPGADEYCDDIDNDCDGDTDESALDASTWFFDADGDAFGDASISTESCSPPDGYTDNDDDCDDTNAMTNPMAEEYCDGIDNDCDGSTDDEDSDVVDSVLWFADSDGDGYGGDDVIFSCLLLDGYTSIDGDCNDGDASTHPGAEEVCGDVTDNDCNGEVDETCASYPHNNGQGVTWYNGVPTGTMSSEQAKLSCEQTYGTCHYTTADCAGPGWCESAYESGGKCWGWTSGCSGGEGRVWQYSSSYTTYGTWN